MTYISDLPKTGIACFMDISPRDCMELDAVVAQQQGGEWFETAAAVGRGVFKAHVRLEQVKVVMRAEPAGIVCWRDYYFETYYPKTGHMGRAVMSWAPEFGWMPNVVLSNVHISLGDTVFPMNPSSTLMLQVSDLIQIMFCAVKQNQVQVETINSVWDL